MRKVQDPLQKEHRCQDRPERKAVRMRTALQYPPRSPYHMHWIGACQQVGAKLPALAQTASISAFLSSPLALGASILHAA